MNKKSLSERDICTKFIVPAITLAGWDILQQVREEHYFTAGQVLVRGKTVKRGKRKFADFLLSWKPNIPLAIIEAKDNNHSVGSGMQQGLDYAGTLDVPLVFSTNGDAFLFHDRLATSGVKEQELPLDQFPSPTDLWQRYFQAEEINQAKLPVITQDYYSDGSGRIPRYYQSIAVSPSRTASTTKKTWTALWFWKNAQSW